MTRAQRRRHFLTWLVLGPAIVALVWAAVAMRAPVNPGAGEAVAPAAGGGG